MFGKNLSLTNEAALRELQEMMERAMAEEVVTREEPKGGRMRKRPVPASSGRQESKTSSRKRRAPPRRSKETEEEEDEESEDDKDEEDSAESASSSDDEDESDRRRAKGMSGLKSHHSAMYPSPREVSPGAVSMLSRRGCQMKRRGETPDRGLNVVGAVAALAQEDGDRGGVGGAEEEEASSPGR